MSFSFGKNIKVNIFGASHSPSIGGILEGLPSGIKINEAKINNFIKRRSPKNNPLATKRNEADSFSFLSGVFNGKTNGGPLCVVINNTDIDSSPYEKLKDTPRPSHADYPAMIKYNFNNDYLGGGFFSGRLTAPLTILGAIANELLEEKGIYIFSHIYQIGEFVDEGILDKSIEELISFRQKADSPILNEKVKEEIINKIAEIKEENDSIGGILECVILNLPVGIGEPIFNSIESELSKAMFSIPGVKGIEFGLGFEGALKKGSEFNDSFYYDNQIVKTKTNNNGGILGGLSNGMPLYFKLSIKPTPSIGKEQKSINLKTKEEVSLKIKGRHDPCIALRVPPIIEALASLVILDLLKEAKKDEY